MIRLVLAVAMLWMAVLAPRSLNAACLVLHPQGDRVLLVDDKGIDLPGGHHRAGETPQQTAVRETWEEAGIRVTAHQRVSDPGNPLVFRCRSLEGPNPGKGQWYSWEEVEGLQLRNSWGNKRELIRRALQPP